MDPIAATDVDMRDDHRISIRAATSADLSAIEALLTESHLPTVGVRESLGAFLVAEASDHIVGVVGMETCAELRRSGVAAAWPDRSWNASSLRQNIREFARSIC